MKLLEFFGYRHTRSILDNQDFIIREKGGKELFIQDKKTNIILKFDVDSKQNLFYNGIRLKSLVEIWKYLYLEMRNNNAK
jgi:hypothetical protein